MAGGGGRQDLRSQQVDCGRSLAVRMEVPEWRMKPGLLFITDFCFTGKCANGWV